MDAKRIEEAEQCLKKADKYLQTSLINLKFKPDYDSAAAELERAAVCFKNARALDRCLSTYIRAAECHEKNGIMFHAAKCKENAALIAKDLGQLDKARELMETASQIYFESGTAETSGQALDKAGRFFEANDPEKAIQIYRKAFDIVSASDNTRQASDFLNRITKLLVSGGKYKEACANIDLEIELYKDLDNADKIGQLTCGLVLLNIQQGDTVAARKAYQNSFRVKNFENTQAARFLGALIESYEQGDEKKFQLCLSQPLIKGQDNEFLRLTRNMHVPAHLRKQEEASQQDESTSKEAVPESLEDWR